MMPEGVQQVLIGSLLGDGSIPSRGKGACFSEGHSIKQLDYLKWKVGLLSPRFGGNLSIWHKMASFHTRSHPKFAEMRRLWYPNGKKVVPEEELQKLNELGLAVWYQDDGSYNYSQHVCALPIYSRKGQETAIQKWFVERWGLNPHITYGPTLQFSVKDSDKLLHLIAEHIHPSMVYKLGHLHPSNKTRIEDVHRRVLERQRKYREKNRGKLRESYRKFCRDHHERKLEQRRGWYQRHKDEISRKRHERYWKNRDRYLQLAHERYMRDRDKITQRVRNYYWNNREKCLRYRREYRQRKKLLRGRQ